MESSFKNPKEKIKDDTKRYVSFCKRKRGFLKKAIELSCLCDQYIHVTIFDKTKQRLVEYSSHDEFSHRVVSNLINLNSGITHERYNNLDYNLFSQAMLG